MPSKIHQILLGLIGRKMRDKGYLPVAFDGKSYTYNGESINIPPMIKRHRPDVIGININTKAICIGEAKTENDLFSKRTKEQLLDYSNIMGITSGQKMELIIGIPSIAEFDLIRLLSDLKLDQLLNISYVILPTELVENGEENIF